MDHAIIKAAIIMIFSTMECAINATVLQMQNSSRVVSECVKQVQNTRAQVIACNQRLKKLHRNKEHNIKVIRIKVIKIFK